MKRAPFAAILGLATVVACKAKMDDAKAEEALTAYLENQKVPVTRVSCPSNVEMNAGTKFECSVDLEDGNAIKVPVTLLDEKRLEWGAVITTKRLEERILETGKVSDVRCSGGVIQPKKGDKIACSATTAGKGFQLDVLFTDDEGGFQTVSK